MDLGAYAQIDILDQIMKDNNIDIPRLRGLRLMKDEKPLTKNDREEVIKCEDHFDGTYVDIYAKIKE